MRGHHKEAAIRLPVVAEGESEFGRRRVPGINRGEVGLMIFFEHLCVRHISSIAIDFPVFWERTERDAGVVLNDDAAVLEKKAAHAGETFAVHEIRGGLEQT